MKKIYFLSGLPRSGSTVLAALLQQHPEMHTTATSGLLDMLMGTLKARVASFGQQSSTKDAMVQEKEMQRILKAICEAKYADVMSLATSQKLLLLYAMSKTVFLLWCAWQSQVIYLSFVTLLNLLSILKKRIKLC